MIRHSRYSLLVQCKTFSFHLHCFVGLHLQIEICFAPETLQFHVFSTVFSIQLNIRPLFSVQYVFTFVGSCVSSFPIIRRSNDNGIIESFYGEDLCLYFSRSSIFQALDNLFYFYFFSNFFTFFF